MHGTRPPFNRIEGGQLTVEGLVVSYFMLDIGALRRTAHSDSGIFCLVIMSDRV